MTTKDALKQLYEEIKALPSGTTVHVIHNGRDILIRGGPYGKEWVRWKPKESTQEEPRS